MVMKIKILITLIHNKIPISYNKNVETLKDDVINDIELKDKDDIDFII